ncbi:MAG: hypothetical protein HC778_03410 [Chamaesiphon sp. CSU_1_12]|nr:hypothetical protein [Chamaesiphon sp. CSU_1_12]
MTVCIAGASLLPQFDPEDEREKISKLLEKQRAASQQGKADELIARAKALDELAFQPAGTADFQVLDVGEGLEGHAGEQLARLGGGNHLGKQPPLLGFAVFRAEQVDDQHRRTCCA